MTFMLTLKEVWDLSFLFARSFQPRLPVDVLWGSFVTEPQRTSAGRLISAKNSIKLDISSLPFLCKQQNYNHFSFMASKDPIQEVEGDYRNSKTSFVKGVRMPLIYVYETGFEEFIDKFQTRIDDVFIVGIPRSGKI